MSDFKKIVIAGLGLIGGSLSLSLKKNKYPCKIVGIEREKSIHDKAFELGLVDEKMASLDETCRDADLFVLCVPVAQTENVLKVVLPYLPSNCLITDTGSTKCDVVAQARSVLKENVGRFIPAHPIAGLEKNGPEAAINNLFEGKKTVIAQLPENKKQDVQKIQRLWQSCGAIIHHLTPQEHDLTFATVSHMPHLLAYALVNMIVHHPQAELFFQYAASGFRDFTRIAASSPEMWRDISMANRDHLLAALEQYLLQLENMKQALVANDSKALFEVFDCAQQARQNWAKTIESGEKK